LDIFSHIISVKNLFCAWKEFCRGKRNKPDVAQFEFNLEGNLFQLHNELVTKEYTHSPYVAFYVCDPKLRHIHKACVRDRVLHQALFRIIYPVFDRYFIHDSYSCRFNKGTHAAVNRFHDFSRKCSTNWRENVFILKCDIKKFFDSVDHHILFDLLYARINDADVLRLIKQIINSFEKEDNKALPLGNVTSQLFANIYLNELDQFVKRELKEKYYIRYCDDFVILSQDKDYLLRILTPIRKFLQNCLNLQLHEDKISIGKYNQGIDFLGYVSFPHFRVLRTKTKRRMMRKIKKEKEALNAGVIDAQSFESSLQSYFGILSHCNGYKIKESIIDILTSGLYN
jgi:retron-type reverse transcriptase